MTNQERISALILKKLGTELSEEENREIENWLAIEENRAFFEREMKPRALYDPVEHRAGMDEKAIDKRVYTAIRQRPPVKPFIRIFRWVAAAGVIGLLAGTGLHLYRRSASKIYPIEPSKQFVIHPGSNKARLQLANGTVIELDTAKNGSIAVQAGTMIVKNGAAVHYTASSGIAGTEAYNVLTTPRAGQFQIILPDGSKVWLNNVSTLRYPVVFSGKERRVELTGEAFFEVAKLTGKPFYVSAGNSTIAVLGTSFNVSAYADEDLHRTTLVDGKVKVTTSAATLVLNSGEQAEEADAKLTIRHPDVYGVISWRNGFFNFSDASVEAVMKQIGRWYDVKIEYEGRPATQKLEGSISRNQDLSETLAALELLKIHTRLKDSTVIVFP